MQETKSQSNNVAWHRQVVESPRLWLPPGGRHGLPRGRSIEPKLLDNSDYQHKIRSDMQGTCAIGDWGNLNEHMLSDISDGCAWCSK